MTDLWELVAEETRESFSELESLVSTLDVKSSIVVVIDGVLLTALSLIQDDFRHLNIIIRVLILLPLFLSVLFSAGCLFPRKWNRIFGPNLINEYECSEDPDFVACEISKTRSELEKTLQKVYDNKFMLFRISTLFMLATLIGEFILFAYLFVDP